MRLRIVLVVALFASIVACDGTAPPAEQAAAGETAATPGDADVGARPVVEVPGGPSPAELLTEDLIVGTGAIADEESTVTVHYVAVAWSTGEEFESSWERRNPRTFALPGTIDGFRQGVAGMAVGGRRRIVIPPQLAYADEPPAGLRPRETLVFVVDLVAVR